MMKLILVVLLLVFALMSIVPSTFAYYGERRYRDAYGNAYSNPNNLWRDADNDGVVGYWDARDDDSSRTYF
jgi:hypothetical protein